MATKPAKRDPLPTRARILEAAKQQLIQGDGHFEMAWVARAAHISQGLAYHHFGSKEGLLNAVVHDFYDRIEASVLLARFDQYADWEQRERARVKRYIEFLLADPLAQVLMTRLARTAAVATVEAERWERLVRVGAANFAEGKQRGDVASQLDSTLLAAMALGAVRAAVSESLLRGPVGEPEALARQIWSFIRGGIGSQA